MKRTFSKWRGLALGLLLTAGTAGTAQAQTGTEVAIAAGVAAGMLVAVPTVTEIFTYSKVSVKIEAFTETVALPTNMYAAANLSWTNSPDLRRTQPFKLGEPTSAKRAADAAKLDQQQQFLAAAYKLGESAKRLDTLILQLNVAVPIMRNLADEAVADNPASETAKALANVATDFDKHLAAAQILREAINSYLELMKQFSAAPMNAADMVKANASLQEVRAAGNSAKWRDPIESATADAFSIDVTELFQQRDNFVFSTTNAPDTNAPPPGDRSTIPSAVGTQINPPSSLPAESKIAYCVFNTLRILAMAATNSGAVTVKDQKIKFADTVAFEKQVVQLMNYYGYPVRMTAEEVSAQPGTVSLAALKQATSPAALQGLLVTYSLPTQLDQVGRLSVEINTYSGVASGANIGPIVNEAFQTVFGQSRIIDAMLSDDDKWKKMNFAYSKSHAGDHNTVIYFDNNLTPVIKTGSFDPGDIIAANAQLYIRVANAMASIYGLPANSTTAWGSPTNPAPIPELNVYSQKARAQNAELAAANDRKAMLTVLTKLVALGGQMQTNITAAGVWAGTSATDTGTAQVGTLTNTLAQVYQTLQSRSSSTGL